MRYEISLANLNRVRDFLGAVILAACVQPAMAEPLKDFAMAYNYQFLRNAMQRQHIKRLVHDYMRYTFTAAFGVLQSIGALVTLIIIVLARNNPLLILIIFCLYVIIFLVATVISFFAWRKHKRFYESVFKK